MSKSWKAMMIPILGRKLSWLLYRKGFFPPTAALLKIAAFGGVRWFDIAESMIDGGDSQDMRLITEQLLRPKNFVKHGKRDEFVQLAGKLLVKANADVRRSTLKFIDSHPGLFTYKDEIICGALTLLSRRTDFFCVQIAKEALMKIRKS